MLVIVSKEFVGYLLAAIGPIALGKIYDVCHSWTMPLVLLQGGDTVVFKDLYRFTREAENGYKKYMECSHTFKVYPFQKVNALGHGFKPRTSLSSSSADFPKLINPICLVIIPAYGVGLSSGCFS